MGEVRRRPRRRHGETEADAPAEDEQGSAPFEVFVDVGPPQYADDHQGCDAYHPGDRVVDAVDALGEPRAENEEESRDGPFLQRRQGAGIALVLRQLIRRVGTEDEVDHEHRRGHGNQRQRKGELDPVEEADLDAGELLQEGRGNHAATAADQGRHPAAGAGERERQKHEAGGVGVGFDPRGAHQRDHGGDADGGGRGVVQHPRRQPEADGEDEGEPDHAGAGPFRDGVAEPFGQPGLLQSDGEDQAAHDEDHHRVHVGRPGGRQVDDVEGDQQDADHDGGDLERDRLDHEEKDQRREHGEKAERPGRKPVDVADLDFGAEFGGRGGEQGAG